MSRPYAPKQVLRHLPGPLLRRFLDRQGVGRPGAWADDPDALYTAWLDLPPADRAAVEAMLRAVHDLADPDALRMLAEEAAFEGDGGIPVPDGYGLHAAALWHLLAHPAGFHRVRLIREAGDRTGRYWHRTAGLPATPPDLSPRAVQDLKAALAGYLRAEQGRGHRVTVEHYPRPGGEVYVFCYPDDYTHTHVGHDERGTLRRTPVRPAFEVVFAVDPGAGALDTYVPGPKATRLAVVGLFCRAVLGADPPDESPHRPGYELNRLLDPHFVFPTDPADGVLDVRVRRLRVTPPGTKRRVVLEAAPDGPPLDVFAFLDELLPADRYPRARLNVTQAALSVSYRPAGADRPRTLTFEVTYPGGCSLTGKPDDQRALGEKWLRRWGIAGG